MLVLSVTLACFLPLCTCTATEQVRVASGGHVMTFNVSSLLALGLRDNARVLCARAFQFGQKSFDLIRFGNLINLRLVN